jgi:transcriptional regulator with XRE-family HTH domain
VAPAGDFIRAARERAGITQAALAVRAGTSQATISRLECGQRSVGLETLQRLLLVMGERLELSATPLEGRFDPVHLAAEAQLSPAQRLERAFQWTRFNDDLLRAGRRARSR